MAADGKLIFDTEIDLSGIEKGLAGIAKATQATLKRFKEELSSMGKAAGEGAGEGIQEGVSKGTSGMGDMLTKVVSMGFWKDAGKALVDFSKQGIQTAADLAKSQKVIDATFGSSAEEMNAWAKDAKNAYGISELSAKKFTGTMGMMLKSMGATEEEAASMSQGIVGLAGDMASFYDLSPEEAFNMLKDAVEGNSEALNSLGVEMTDQTLKAYLTAQGTKEVYDEMSEAEKASLRYKYAMEAMAGAQGDFAESSGDTANQVSLFELNVGSLASTIGEALLPAVNWVLTAVNGLFGGTGKTGLSEEVDGAIKSLGTVKSDVATLRKDYAKTTIEIKLNYEKAEGLLDDYAALEGLLGTVDEDKERMVEITSALKAMYPELDKYIGKDGLFAKDTQAVRDYMAVLTELSKQDALQTHVEGLKAQQEEKRAAYDILIQEQKDQYSAMVENHALAEEAVALQEKINAITTIASSTGWVAMPESIHTMLNTDDLGTLLPVLQEVYDKTEHFKNLDLKGIDWNVLIKDGALQSAQYFEQNADAMAILCEVLLAVNQELPDVVEGYNKAAEAASENYFELGKNIEAATPELEKLDREVAAGTTLVEQNAAAITAQGAAADATGEKITGLGNKRADAIDGLEDYSTAAAEAGEAATDTAGKVEDASATVSGEIDDLETKAQTVTSLYEQIQAATTAGTEAEGTLAAAKLAVSEDSAAMILEMETLLVSLGVKIKEFVDTVPLIVADGELGATTAGRSLVAAIGTGASEDTTFTAAVTAQVSAAGAVLVSSMDSFYSHGASIISQLAAGVNNNSSVLANAVANAVAAAVNAASTRSSSASSSSSNRYGHRTGLDYVPYDEYPANLHKGEAVLTATEAALWRGGMNARDMQINLPRTDYDAMADAFWARAPQSEAPNLYLDGERVARLIEPALSKVQEIKLRR